MALLGQLANAVVAQGRDPVQIGRLEIGRDACLGQHAAVADHGQPLQAEALAQLVDLGTERAGIGGVAETSTATGQPSALHSRP